MGIGCGDDNAVTPGEVTSASVTDSDATPITFSMDSTSGSTTVVADDTASGGTSSTGPTDTTTTTTGDTTTTGGEAIPGQTVSQLVSAGERSTSPNYALVYTLGQPSSLQGTHQSPNYTIH